MSETRDFYTSTVDVWVTMGRNDVISVSDSLTMDAEYISLSLRVLPGCCAALIFIPQLLRVCTTVAMSVRGG